MTEAFSPLASLRKALSASRDTSHASQIVAKLFSEFLNFDQVILLSESGESWSSSSVAGITIRSGEASLRGRAMRLPLFVSDPQRQRIDPMLREQLEENGVKSYLLVPVYAGDRMVAALEAFTIHEHLRLRGEERAYSELAATLLGLRIEREIGSRDDFYTSPEHRADLKETEVESSPLSLVSKPSEIESRVAERADAAAGDLEEQRRSSYRRIAEHGELLIVRTDPALRVTELVGDTQRLFGFPADELLSSPSRWRRSFRAHELRRVLRRARSLPFGEFNDEVQVTNQLTGEVRWILMRAIPFFANGSDQVNPSLMGWEGFWVDTTARRAAEERSRSQGRRIEALYEVARSLELNLDPSVVALKGLRALIRATGSDCGFSGLIDPSTGQLEVVAAEGLSSQYVEDVGAIIGKHTLARDAVDRREGVLLSNIQQEPRAAVELARREGVRATIIMPLVFEEQVLGVMVLFRRTEAQYSTDDYDLVSAACAQIALAARQAELYAAEKRHSSSLSALYRLSHELSKQMTLKEVAEHAFPSIQEEIACKRMWLGVMNNRGSHLMGTAGVGPGIRKHVVDMQVELGAKNQLLDRAIRTRSPVVFDASAEQECGDLGRVLARLNCGTIVIVPLVALGQVVGVLVVEPAVPSTFFVQRKLPLLNSMATEIATVILARKFEARMADADKMRMAGLLASGVAHNFNNLLQAVMGQASLIEMQMGHDKRVTQSARMINDAASKGASLVKQLFNFSMQGGFAPTTLSVQSFLEDSKELYRSVLGAGIELEYDVTSDAPPIVADQSQLQQVITNLLVNSKEALEGRSDGKVKVFVRRVKVRSGEVDPELAPGEYLRVEVEDNGPGMTPESQTRCFEPFFTTKNIDTRTGLGFGGSGLGLSSAYSIVKQHDGAITVRTQQGQGTTFSVYLPAVSGETATGTHVGVGGSDRATEFTHVFMFEIDSAIGYSLRSSFEGPHADVAIPLTRERLLQMLRQVRDVRALVLIDLDRVGTVATDLVASILQIHPAVNIFGYVADLQHWESKELARDRCQLFEKPLRIWSMSEQIRSVLENRLTGGSLALRVSSEVENPIPPVAPVLPRAQGSFAPGAVHPGEVHQGVAERKRSSIPQMPPYPSGLGKEGSKGSSDYAQRADRPDQARTEATEGQSRSKNPLIEKSPQGVRGAPKEGR